MLFFFCVSSPSSLAPIGLEILEEVTLTLTPLDEASF